MDGDQQTVEQRAEAMGWIPLDQFKGDPERWVDAASFVERGETLLPFMRASNKKLESELETVRKQLAEQAALAAQQAENVQALKDSAYEMAQMQHKRALSNLKAQLVNAKKDGDAETEVEVQEAIAELRGKEPQKPKPVEKPAPQNANPLVDTSAQYFKDFQARNPWMDKDIPRTAWLIEETKALAARGYRNEALVEAVQARVDEVWGERTTTRRGDKMEGSRGGAGTSSGRAGSKTFESLPADVQAACMRQAPRLVGEGKAHKTLADWKKSYVEQYYAE